MPGGNECTAEYVINFQSTVATVAHIFGNVFVFYKLWTNILLGEPVNS